MSPRRLYRSRSDRQLAGVAGGIAQYLDVDPTMVRILWILSIFVGGFGILLYLIMAVIVPLEPTVGQAPGYGRGATWGTPAGSTATTPVAPTGEPPADEAPADGTTAEPGAGWQAAAERRPGRGGLVVGVLLVAFGGIALAGAIAPGWIAWPALGPMFLVALGVALLVGATRRTTAES